MGNTIMKRGSADRMGTIVLLYFQLRQSDYDDPVTVVPDTIVDVGNAFI